MHRSVTDLTIDLDFEDESLYAGTSSEIHKLSVKIREIAIKFMETKLVMVLVLNSGKVNLYEDVEGYKN
jgi:hypothetical protein